jgi:formyltetrahydrofolate synthetase
LYPLELSLKDKIEIICKEMYGADGVEYSEQAEQRIQVRVITLMGAIVSIILFIFLLGKGLH